MKVTLPICCEYHRNAEGAIKNKEEKSKQNSKLRNNKQYYPPTHPQIEDVLQLEDKLDLNVGSMTRCKSGQFI